MAKTSHVPSTRRTRATTGAMGAAVDSAMTAVALGVVAVARAARLVAGVVLVAVPAQAQAQAPALRVLSETARSTRAAATVTGAEVVAVIVMTAVARPRTTVPRCPAV